MQKVLFGVVILLILPSAAPVLGAVSLDIALARTGSFAFSASSPAAFSRSITTTDSNELSKVFALPASGRAIGNFSFDISTPQYTDPLAGPTPVPSSSAVVRAPQDLDAGNWAMAIGVFDDFSMVSFLQYRLAGGSATVTDTSLAQQAVSAGLWTGANDYFEFPASHAGISQSGLSQSGPGSFFSFEIPEPQAWRLAAVAGIFWSRCARRKS